jgi:hypothetical protein
MSTDSALRDAVEAACLLDARLNRLDEAERRNGPPQDARLLQEFTCAMKSLGLTASRLRNPREEMQ